MSVIAETIRIFKGEYPDLLKDVHVEDLVIGVFFTGVRLSRGHAGVAFTPIGEIPEAVCCPTTAARMPNAGNFIGKPAWEALEYALDSNVLKSAIGIATLNALSQAFLESEAGRRYPFVRATDGFDLLKINPQDTVSLIGAFGPYIRRLKMMGNPFFIIERNTKTLRADEFKYFMPEAEMDSALDRSDAVIMTGTAIVNHTIDQILSLLTKKSRVAIIGPTASMLPEVFFHRGIQIMAGIRILDPDAMVEILKQGGSGYHLMQMCAEKIAFVKG